MPDDDDARNPHRGDAWRSSGERAEDFSKRAGYAASMLRWWASKLKRDPAPAAPPRPALDVRIARVVRSVPSEMPNSTRAKSPIVLEVVRAGVRIEIEAGADRATLAIVLEMLDVGAAR
jgi:hypothetical protein